MKKLFIYLLLALALSNCGQNKNAVNSVDKRIIDTPSSIDKNQQITHNHIKKNPDTIVLDTSIIVGFPISFDGHDSNEDSIYYEYYIGKAYNKSVFDKNFITNKANLDSLIDIYSELEEDIPR